MFITDLYYKSDINCIPMLYLKALPVALPVVRQESQSVCMNRHDECTILTSQFIPQKVNTKMQKLKVCTFPFLFWKLCPLVSHLAFQFLPQVFFVHFLTCPCPSSLHLFLVPSLVCLYIVFSLFHPPCSVIPPYCFVSHPWCPVPVSNFSLCVSLC